jgi:transcriptional regulator with XRE-family HTH domain
MGADISEVRGRFAVNLARARRRARFTQEALAFQADLHPTWISHLESGRHNPRLDTMARLAGPLGVDAADLLARGL